jgi:hypothetical protein
MSVAHMRIFSRVFAFAGFTTHNEFPIFENVPLAGSIELHIFTTRDSDLNA